MSFFVEYHNGTKWVEFVGGSGAPGSGPYDTRKTAEDALKQRARWADTSVDSYRIRDLNQRDTIPAEPKVPPGTPLDSNGFVVKDSGKRENLAGGMVRDTTEGKVDYTLITDGPMFQRWADHLTKGAIKYEKRNWMKCAEGDKSAQEKTLARFKESAFRHFIMWMNGDRSEDHCAGVFFNLNGYEYLKGVMDAGSSK